MYCIVRRDFKNTDQNNTCASIVLKAKTEKNDEEKQLVDLRKRAFLSFELKSFKNILFSSYFLVLALKTIDTQVLLWSVFLKMHKKSY